MENRVAIAGLSVEKTLYDVIGSEILPGTGCEPEAFFAALARLVADFGPENRHLLAKRDAMQAAINVWHHQFAGRPHDAAAYKCFLSGIGYMLPEGPDFTIETRDVDPEIASVAGPQLVVPLTNARYAINAANARWGSLYDALYGSDVIAETDGSARGPGYNPARGAKVMAYAAAFLDTAVPLAAGSHAEVADYGLTSRDGRTVPVVTLADGQMTGLADAGQFSGHVASSDETAFFFRNHGLYVQVCVNRAHPVGATHPAGVRDVITRFW